MPMPTMLCLAFASGVATAVAGRAELRLSPRPALLTQSCGAWIVFGVLVLVPVSVYFYLFHGDWFLMYWVDVRVVPSAVAMVGFIAELGIGVGGLAAGAALVRAQRDALAAVLAVCSALLGGAVVLLGSDRLAQVGTLAQYRGGFGLVPYGGGALMSGSVAMGLLLLAGIATLLGRVHLGGRRR